MCLVPAQDESIVRSTDNAADTAPTSEHVATSIASALEAINSVMEWKGKEIRAQERIVEQLRRGVDEELPEGLLASVNQAESAMKSVLRDMRWKVESYKKVADIPEHLAIQLADIDKKIVALTAMERSLTPLIREETRYRNPQRLPRDARYA